MSEIEQSRTELIAENQKLRDQLSRQERELQEMRERAGSTRRWATTRAHQRFTVELDQQGRVRELFLDPAEGGPFRPADLRRLLTSEKGQERCQRALKTGQAVTFQAPSTTARRGGKWVVVLVPSASEYSSVGVLRGGVKEMGSEAFSLGPLTGGGMAKKADLFDKAFHLGPAALMIARIEDGIVLDASNQMLELTGYSAGELVGKALPALSLWADASVRTDLAKRLLTDRTIRNREFRIRRKDGTMRTVLGSARCVEINGWACMLGSAIDITRRKQAAEAEYESRTLLHKIFHASPAPIGIMRLKDGRFLNANEAMSTLVGCTPDVLIGQSLRELDLWGAPPLREVFAERLSEPHALYDCEAELRTRKGDRITVLASFQRIQVESEPCVLVVMQDITSRKRAEEALLEAKEQAEKIAQFRSTMLTNLTHEVRTPLTVILGFTSILRRGTSDEYRRFVQLIERSGQRLLITLDSLLDLAQLEAGTLEVNLEVHDVIDVVHGTAESLTALAERKELDLVINLPQRHAFVEIDYELFARALTHLIDNAVKFTEEGTITVAAALDDETVRIQIRDTGIGIDEEFTPRVFEAFSQESEGLNRTHQGSGLGLTIAQRLIEEMHGEIQVESSKGEGSVFAIVLPRFSQGRSSDMLA